MVAETDEFMNGAVSNTTPGLDSGAGRPALPDPQAAQLHEVAQRLTGEFAPVLPVEAVPRVVNRTCRDLVHEVPSQSLPEFVFQGARQRLLDAAGPDAASAGGRRPVRRRVS